MVCVCWRASVESSKILSTCQHHHWMPFSVACGMLLMMMPYLLNDGISICNFLSEKFHQVLTYEIIGLEAHLLQPSSTAGNLLLEHH